MKEVGLLQSSGWEEEGYTHKGLACRKNVCHPWPCANQIGGQRDVFFALSCNDEEDIKVLELGIMRQVGEGKVILCFLIEPGLDIGPKVSDEMHNNVVRKVW